MGHCPKSSNKPRFVFCEVWWSLGMISDISFAKSLSEQTTPQMIIRMSFRCSTSCRCSLSLFIRLNCCSFCESWLGKRSVRFPSEITRVINFGLLPFLFLLQLPSQRLIILVWDWLKSEHKSHGINNATHCHTIIYYHMHFINKI